MEKMQGKKYKQLAITDQAIKTLSHAAVDEGISPKLYMQKVLEDHARQIEETNKKKK